MDTVRIVISDENLNPLFEKDVPRELAMQSGILKSMIECCEDEDTIPLPVDNIRNEECFDATIEYCQFMLSPDYPKDREAENIDGELTPWEHEFMNRLSVERLYELIMVANFLDIPRFLEPLCYWAAQGLKGKSPEEIRDMFGIKNDFTHEEMEQLKQENRINS